MSNPYQSPTTVASSKSTTGPDGWSGLALLGISVFCFTAFLIYIQVALRSAIFDRVGQMLGIDRNIVSWTSFYVGHGALFIAFAGAISASLFNTGWKRVCAICLACLLGYLVIGLWPFRLFVG